MAIFVHLYNTPCSCTRQHDQYTSNVVQVDIQAHGMSMRVLCVYLYTNADDYIIWIPVLNHSKTQGDHHYVQNSLCACALRV